MNLLIIILVTAIIFLCIKGLELDQLASVFDGYWQYLDLPLLFADPVNSLLYLHAQPPLLNAIVYFLHLLPGDLYTNFLIINSASVGIIAWIIFTVVRKSTSSNYLGAISAGAYTIFPSTILNASYPFYPVLTALGYGVLVYSFFLIKQTTKKSVIFFVGAVVYLSLLRSSFSLAHCLLFIAIYCYCLLPHQKNKIYVVSVVIFSLSMSLIVPLKNMALYDFFGSSSWAPLNLAYGVGIPRERGYFPPPELLKEEFPDLKCKYSYHDQDSMIVKSNGMPNFNSCLILEYARSVRQEGLHGYDLVRHLKYYLTNTAIYFSPSDKYRQLTNRTNIESYANFVNLLQLTLPVSAKHEIRVLPFTLLVASILLSWSRKNLFQAICSFILVSHYLTHTLTDGYESNRFVVDVEFIFFIMLGLLFQTNHQNIRRYREQSDD